MSMDIQSYQPKTFWQKPEGKTGMLFLIGAVLGGGYLLWKILPTLINLVENTLYLGMLLMALAGLLYLVFSPKVRTLVSYMFKSVMRWVTGVFIQIDPIGILKNYIEDLKDNLRKMNKQTSNLRGQMHKLKTIMDTNERQIKNNLTLASKAKENDKQAIMVLKTRKAGRLKESNMKLGDLYKKMEILYRVLTKMYENSEILLEDIKDQVSVKEIERKAIRTSHSAMKSAMSVLSGSGDKRVMFDRALEAIADDVSEKVGEMEQFMDMSSNIIDSIDLQNGVFEEEGIQMLEKWEKEGVSKLLGEEKETLLIKAENVGDVLDLNEERTQKVRATNQYDNLFD